MRRRIERSIHLCGWNAGDLTTEAEKMEKKIFCWYCSRSKEQFREIILYFPTKGASERKAKDTIRRRIERSIPLWS